MLTDPHVGSYKTTMTAFGLLCTHGRYKRTVIYLQMLTESRADRTLTRGILDRVPQGWHARTHFCISVFPVSACSGTAGVANWLATRSEVGIKLSSILIGSRSLVLSLFAESVNHETWYKNHSGWDTKSCRASMTGNLRARADGDGKLSRCPKMQITLLS